MHLVFDVQRAHDNNQLVLSQCVGKLSLDKLDDRIQWLVCTDDTGLTRIKEYQSPASVAPLRASLKMPVQPCMGREDRRRLRQGVSLIRHLLAISCTPPR